MTATIDRWLTIPRALKLLNANQPEDEQISIWTARRRLAAMDAEAQKSGFKILRRFGPRTTLVNADALLQLLRVDTSLLTEELGHLHSRFDEIEAKTTRNRQGINQLRKQMKELSDRLDRALRRER